MQLEVKTSHSMRTLTSIFFYSGISIVVANIIVSIWLFLTSPYVDLRELTLIGSFLFVGCIFTAIGWFSYQYFYRDLRFDKMRQKLFTIEFRKIPHERSLNEIHAVQVLGQRFNSVNGLGSGNIYSTSGICYEINLIFTDGARQNVTAFGKIEQTFNKAKAISDFLGVALWTPVKNE